MEVALPPRYELHPTDPVLGEGGMGKVWRARDVVMDVPVAIKVVRPDLASDKRFRKLFDLEVRIAARFTHDHIVPLHDLGELGDGTPFLGLALADSGSFANLHETGDWSEILRLTLELLDALAHLHSRGVLHRDLKPENVLLNTGKDGKPHVWLADLGLAKAATDLAKRKGRTEGTPGFMAPEQRLGLPREYGPWTDLFSVGVMLWELVTGELPFGEDRSPMNTELPPLVPREGMVVPDGLDLVLANLLAAEPLSRYDIASDLSTELLALESPALDRTKAMDSVRQGQSGPRVGTVAPSAPRPTPPTTSISEDSPGEHVEPKTASSTWYSGEEGEEGLVVGVPLWNRPLPGPLPPEPPPEPGLGGTARASLPLFALRELPLVARGEWRSLLWEQARAVAADRKARVVLVIGEAGSGKTHLVESVVRALQEGGWAESAGLTYGLPACSEDGYAGAARAILRPWNESRSTLEARLQRGISRERGSRDDVVLEEASLLARWCGLLEEGEQPVAAGLGLREVYRYLEARAWRGLSVLVLDNVQWAAEEGDGLSIAESLVQSTQDGKESPILALATLRSEDVSKDPQLQERIQALVAAGAIELDLPRLDRAGTESLLNESLTLAPELARRVAERCEGNPLFARQLLLDWADHGWLVDTGGLKFGLAPGVDADAVMPRDAQALFVERVNALAQASGAPQEFTEIVHLAAMAGQSFPKSLLAILAGPELYETVRGSGLWVETDEWVRFDHGLLHQALREQAVAREDVKALHGRLAHQWASLEQAGAQDFSFDIGRHAHAAGDHEMAVDHLMRAAERAFNLGRTRELEAAAELAVEACNQDRRVKWRAGWGVLWLARVSQVEGRAQEAAERFFKAHQFFAHTEDDEGRMEALVGMGWAAMKRGKFNRAERRYKEAMQLAKAQRTFAGETACVMGLAWMEQQKRNAEGAEILFSRALARYGRLDDQRGAAEALLGKAFVARRTGHLDDALELYQEAEEAHQEADDLLGVARARHGRGVVHRQLRNFKEAQKLYRDALDMAEDLGATQLMMQCRSALGDIFRARGNLKRAQEIYEAHLRWAKRQGVLEDTIAARLDLAQLALIGRDLGAMYQQAKSASKLLETVKGHWMWAFYRLVVATWWAMRGDGEKTYRSLWSASELGLNDTVDQDVAFFLTVICNRARQQRWEQAMRVAGNLALSQWERLGCDKELQRVKGMMQEVLEAPPPEPPPESPPE
ncbi:MAG: tetratricopeptide repeat protein [Deltaproteobacteria bacterium]|nr:tetratricopeptide repeat protein [Deltaproteobacteria bacterium]MBW2254087.1 tetratricopeptide repeat protein [Deltaproteobacteria bacterium]